jgi:rRNA maturation protein Rpf1
LGRELANVFTNSRYLPRGTKTIARLIELAKKFGQSRVMIINCVAGQPKELRFLEVGEGWRWANAKILLKGVKLQRELGHRMKLDAVGIYQEGGSEEFARTLGSLTGLPLINELRTHAAVLVESGDKKLIQFWTGKSKTGPVLYVEKFEKLYQSEEREAWKPW